MKTSLIPWHVFLDACGKAKQDSLDVWLRRWTFADEGVRLAPDLSSEEKQAARSSLKSEEGKREWI